MFTINATQARNEWSKVSDDVIRFKKPAFIKKIRDTIVLSDLELFTRLLGAYSFHAEAFREADGSVTLVLNEMDLAENGRDLAASRENLAKAILEYSEQYYENFTAWSAAPNRSAHVPYVMKALILSDAKRIGDIIECQAGRI